MSQAAPGELEAVRRFINTLDVDEGTDALASPAALGAWLTEQGLARGPRPDEADWRRAVSVREALRNLVLANGGEPLDPAALETLNAEAARLPLALRFGSAGEAAVVSKGSATERAVGDLLLTVQRAMADGSWRRLKACADDTCQWAFFDHSKNRSGRWCSMAVCGNRHKVREYRRRERKGAAKATGKAPRAS